MKTAIITITFVKSTEATDNNEFIFFAKSTSRRSAIREFCKFEFPEGIHYNEDNIREINIF